MADRTVVHGPALIAKAAQAIRDADDKALAENDFERFASNEQYARAVLNAVAADLQAGALEEAADELGRSATHADELWRMALRNLAAEIRAGAS